MSRDLINEMGPDADRTPTGFGGIETLQGGKQPEAWAQSPRCLGELINEDIHTSNSLCQQEINIKTCDNSIPIIESSKKLWNQQYFTIAFPKPSQPGGKKRLRPSEIQITVPPEAKWIHKLL
nr:cylicin-1-like [Odocoileus virginianus texanus]